MFYTVNFPTRFQTNHHSATDNIFKYAILPWSNALCDHDAHCLILNTFFIKHNVINDKFKNKFKSRLVTKDTLSYFQELLPEETWDCIYSNNDISGIFNDFFKMFVNIFEASFPVIYLNINKDKGWMTIKVSEHLVNVKGAYVFSVNIVMT
jgi:hypothetical protein